MPDLTGLNSNVSGNHLLSLTVLAHKTDKKSISPMVYVWEKEIWLDEKNTVRKQDPHLSMDRVDVILNTTLWHKFFLT